jgi:hypothetical protein
MPLVNFIGMNLGESVGWLPRNEWACKDHEKFMVLSTLKFYDHVIFQLRLYTTYRGSDYLRLYRLDASILPGYEIVRAYGGQDSYGIGGYAKILGRLRESWRSEAKDALRQKPYYLAVDFWLKGLLEKC